MIIKVLKLNETGNAMNNLYFLHFYFTIRINSISY